MLSPTNATFHEDSLVMKSAPHINKWQSSWIQNGHYQVQPTASAGATSDAHNHIYKLRAVLESARARVQSRTASFGDTTQGDKLDYTLRADSESSGRTSATGSYFSDADRTILTATSSTVASSPVESVPSYCKSELYSAPIARPPQKDLFNRRLPRSSDTEAVAGKPKTKMIGGGDSVQKNKMGTQYVYDGGVSRVVTGGVMLGAGAATKQPGRSPRKKAACLAGQTGNSPKERKTSIVSWRRAVVAQI